MADSAQTNWNAVMVIYGSATMLACEPKDVSPRAVSGNV
jgi:hypothetical protein